MDEPLTMERGGQTYYYHRDALGSVTEVSNSSGTIIERYEYDVYGEVSIYDGSYTLLSTSAISNPYLFTGRRFDPESGNYDYRARMYSPSLGRFLSVDPLGFDAGDYNLYRYAFNNPTNLTGPTGEFAIITAIGIAVVVMTIAAYAITAYDLYNAYNVLTDSCSSDEDKLIAGIEVGLAIIFEAIEPDEFLPGGVPADDVARKIAVHKARKALQEGGTERFDRAVRETVGDDVAEKIYREVGLDDLLGACNFNSFCANTVVMTDEGLRIISGLQIGDLVWALNEETSEFDFYPIINAKLHAASPTIPPFRQYRMYSTAAICPYYHN